MSKFKNSVSGIVKKLESELFHKNILNKLKIGIDMGSNSLKAAIVNPTAGKIIALANIPVALKRENRDQELTKEETIEAINCLYREFENKFRSMDNKVNTMVQGKGTTGYYIELPKLKKSEIDLAVYGQTMKQIPFLPNSLSLDYLEVPPISGNSDKTAVFVAVADKSIVDKHRGLIGSPGINIQRIEIPIFPLVREFNANQKVQNGEYYSLVNIGHTLTHLIIMKDGFPYFCREFPLAGRDFTYAFQMGAQNSWKEAEEYKHQYDAQKKEPCILPFTGRWIDQVKNSIEYFAQQYPDKDIKISKIFLSGGGALMKNFHKMVSEEMGLPAEINLWNNLKNQDQNQADYDPMYKIAVGLTLEN